MSFEKASIVIFKDELQTGINIVPDNSIVFVSSTRNVYTKRNSTGLLAGTTVGAATQSNLVLNGDSVFSKILLYSLKTMILSSTATVATAEFVSAGTGRQTYLAGSSVGTNVLFYGGFTTTYSNLLTLLTPAGALAQAETTSGTARHSLAGVQISTGMLAHGGRNDTITIAMKHTNIFSPIGTALIIEDATIGTAKAAPAGVQSGSNALFFGGYIDGVGAATNTITLITENAILAQAENAVGTARREASGASIYTGSLIYAGGLTYTNAVTILNNLATLVKAETFVGTSRTATAGANVGINALFYGGNDATLSYTLATIISPNGTLVQTETTIGGTIAQATAASV